MEGNRGYIDTSIEGNKRYNKGDTVEHKYRDNIDTSIEGNTRYNKGITVEE